MNPPILNYPHLDKPYIISTDASKIACGAYLSQIVDGEEKTIAFASRSFNNSGIYFGITHFRQYVLNTHFKVRTDSKTISTLLNMKNPSAKLLRIRFKLEEYDFAIEHVSGRSNIVPDVLSRIHIDTLTTINIFAMELRSKSKKIELNERKTIKKMTDLQIYQALNV